MTREKKNVGLKKFLRGRKSEFWRSVKRLFSFQRSDLSDAVFISEDLISTSSGMIGTIPIFSAIGRAYLTHALISCALCSSVLL
jgi:hypothetical protein